LITLRIPGVGNMRWDHVVLDLNGTLALDGQVLPGVAERLLRLEEAVNVHVVTADTRGTASEVADRLGLRLRRVQGLQQAEQKQRFLQGLGPQYVIAIGNGNNDALMLEAASLGIAVVGPEGCATRALAAADLVVRDILEALDLPLNPERILATLRL
jgi:P-type E1-E2 ATPase